VNEPRTLTDAIKRIQERLLPIGFIDQLFGRVHLHDESKVGSERAQPIPKALIKDGEYIDCRPSDSYKSVLFFYAPDPEVSDFNRARHSPRHAIRTERNVVLIGWANMKKLAAPYKSVDGFPEEIKVQIRNALKYEPCVLRISTWQDTTLQAAFAPFVVSASDRTYDRWPYVCWRLSLVVQCIENDPV
jgi:hypothetical protein